VTPAVSAAASGQGPRSYRFTDDVAPSAPGPALPASAGPGVAGTGTAGSAAAASVTPQQEAARRYKSALTMIGERDFKGAVLELDQALLLNPQLGAAFAARASALYGLARYKDAARDYQTALGMLPDLATPIFGLAETYRQLDDPRAGDLYARYAASQAGDVKPELREAAKQRAIQYGTR
jgi:tetratricopeptide (TPR) repeat protein